jgi:hypothetical protein
MQDIYLTGNPQITFFKIVYRRHTNYSMEAIEQQFNGVADFGKKVTCTISRNGDLIHRMYLRVELPEVTVPSGEKFRWLDWVGHVLIKSVDFEIGGQRVDKHYGEWLHIWNELTQTAGHAIGYANMVGHTPKLTTLVSGGTVVPSEILYIPMQFWFCRNPGLALPLIALQYHECKCNIEFREVSDCCFLTASSGTAAASASTIATTVGSLPSASLWVDFLYLDTDERRRFAQTSHEYLVEQLQWHGEESISSTPATQRVKLSLNHPCKALYWVVQSDEAFEATAKSYGKQWFNFTSKAEDFEDLASGSNSYVNFAAGAAGGAYSLQIPALYGTGENPVESAKLLLNGHDRFAERDGRYFNLVQPYQHHENVPSKGLCMYSFGIAPENHQPSGTCNFSRIDNATLIVKVRGLGADSKSGGKLKLMAVNYNILRIMSGMGGLAYQS